MSAEIIPVQWYPRTWAEDAEIGDLFEAEDGTTAIAMVARADDTQVVLIWVASPAEILPMAKRVLKTPKPLPTRPTLPPTG